MGNPLRFGRWALVLLVCSLSFFSCWGQISISGPLTHRFIVEPGGSYTGMIEVASNSRNRVHVSITQSDYLFFYDGSNSYAEPGTVERSNAHWISLSLPPDLTLGPNEVISIPFRIRVPADPGSVQRPVDSILYQDPELPSPERCAMCRQSIVLLRSMGVSKRALRRDQELPQSE